MDYVPGSIFFTMTKSPLPISRPRRRQTFYRQNLFPRMSLE